MEFSDKINFLNWIRLETIKLAKKLESITNEINMYFGNFLVDGVLYICYDFLCNKNCENKRWEG